MILHGFVSEVAENWNLLGGTFQIGALFAVFNRMFLAEYERTVTGERFPILPIQEAPCLKEF